LERRPSSLQYNVALRGDLSAEVWPSYLDPTERMRIIETLMRERTISWRSLPSPTTSPILTTQIIISADRALRRIMVHEHDPMGVVYILRNNGNPDYDPHPMVEYAITVGELRSDPRLVLETFVKQDGVLVRHA